jgi:hypothetical protein
MVPDPSSGEATNVRSVMVLASNAVAGSLKYPKFVVNVAASLRSTATPELSNIFAVIAIELFPSAGTDSGLADNTIEAVAPGPVKLTLIGLVIPLAVALICAVPTDPAEYTTAVATPKAFVVAVIEAALFEKFPRVV